MTDVTQTDPDLEYVDTFYSVEDYSWNATLVYRRKSTGRYLTFDDSGCSCYGPGDGLESPADLTEHESFQSLARHLTSEATTGDSDALGRLQPFLTDMVFPK